MSRPRVLFLLALGLLLAAHPMFAANYAVGTCKPSLPSYPTISAAVSAVPSGSTVEVCPGTYSEQVTIAQPLTLKGITSANAGQAVITVPGSGLTVVTSGFGYSIAAQVAVTAGPVNISDITVDGTGNTVGDSGTWLAGIFYDDGSSGTVNEVTLRNLSNSGSTAGIWAENSTATNESLTIENSSFHDIDNSAVITLRGAALSVTAKGNSMETAGYTVQLFAGGSLTGNFISGGVKAIIEGPTSVSGNTVTNASYAGMDIYGYPAAVTVSGNNVTNSGTVGIFLFYSISASGNTVANSPYGIVACCGVTATSNKISNTSYFGIYDEGGGDTYKTNAITKANIGIEFNCQSPTVTGNTINDATTALDSVPSGFSSANSFNNVVTLRTDGCGFGAIHGPDLPTPPSGPMRAAR